MTARLAAFLSVFVLLVLVAGTVHLLGGTDGKPLRPGPAPETALESAAVRVEERHRLFLVVAEQEAAEAARLEAERVAAAQKAQEAERKRRAAMERRTVTGTTQPHRGASPAPSGDIWHRLAMCETGGTMNPRAYNPAGPYYSFFQFGAPDWRRAGGGPGLPWDYSYGEQLRVAQNWQRLVGWKAWPFCARKLGLIK